MIKEELIMEKIVVDYEELKKQKKEMEELIALGKKNRERCIKMLDEHNAILEKKVAEKERQHRFCIHCFF